MDGQCQAWHAIIVFGLHTKSDDVELGMVHGPRMVHRIGRRQAWLDIIDLGQET